MLASVYTSLSLVAIKFPCPTAIFNSSESLLSLVLNGNFSEFIQSILFCPNSVFRSIPVTRKIGFSLLSSLDAIATATADPTKPKPCTITFVILLSGEKSNSYFL